MARRLDCSRCLPMLLVLAIVLSCEVVTALATSHPKDKLLELRAASARLTDFQVYPPVLTPTQDNGAALTNGSGNPYAAQVPLATEGCIKHQTLMVHTFANSYGAPFVGPYAPPSCNFNRVTFNLTVTSAGRQYDRLAVAYFGSTEIWRTSTAEPTTDGIM